MSYTIGDSYIIYDTIKGNYTLSDLLIPCRLVTSWYVGNLYRSNQILNNCTFFMYYITIHPFFI